MPEKQEFSIPKDYKEPLTKDIIYRLDQFPDLIRDKEIEIIDFSKEGLDLNKKAIDRSNLILELMEKEGKYKRDSPQFAQVYKNRCTIDIEMREFDQKKKELQNKVSYEKTVNLNYLVNKFKGAQAISLRKQALSA